MAEIAVFDFEDALVRSVRVEGEPWFVGKDVCRCLGLADHKQALGRLDEDEVMGGGGYIVPPSPGASVPSLISEPGVYRLVFTSRSEAAERFKRWLAHEVLPAIRRTGAYVPPEAAAGIEPPATPLRAEPPLSGLDAEDLYKTAPLLREWRLVWGRATARRLARRLPVMQALIEGEDHILSRLEPRFPPGAPEPPPEDGIDLFVEDVIARGQGARTPAAAVMLAYIEWCGENEIEPATQTRLGRRLVQLGWRKEKIDGRIIYRDLELLLGEERVDAPAPAPAEQFGNSE
jgi:hypothetical protein